MKLSILIFFAFHKIFTYSIDAFLKSFGPEVYDQYPSEFKLNEKVPLWDYDKYKDYFKPCVVYYKNILSGDDILRYFTPRGNLSDHFFPDGIHQKEYKTLKNEYYKCVQKSNIGNSKDKKREVLKAFAFALMLRYMKFKVEQGFDLPFDPVRFSETSVEKSFKELRNYVPKWYKTKDISDPKKFTIFVSSHTAGYDAVESIVMPARLDCAVCKTSADTDISALRTSSVGHRKRCSFLHCWNNDYTQFIRKGVTYLMTNYNQKSFTMKVIYSRKSFTAGHFFPANVKDMFYFVEVMYGFKVRSYFDPCAGWGDRLTAALATKDLNLYVGVDPNPQMEPLYKELIQKFGDDETFAYVVPKPIEKITNETYLLTNLIWYLLHRRILIRNYMMVMNSHINFILHMMNGQLNGFHS